MGRSCRDIAAELGIEHKNFLGTVRKYQTEIEQDFGRIAFEMFYIEMPNGGQREELSHALLTEEQSTYLMTLSKNTPQVIKAKVNLVFD